MIALNQTTDAFDIIECVTEEQWLKERDNGIGASEVAVLLGLSDWASPFSLWAQKRGEMDPGGSDAEFLEWGRFAEAGIADRYAYRTGRKLRDLGRFTILRSKEWPWLFCTLDRVIEHVPQEEGLYPWQPFMTGPGACEIKQATLGGFHAWDEGPPLRVQCQLQTQLAVTGWAWGSIAATMPSGKFDAVDCERNEKFVALLVEKTKAFWDSVQSGIWPPEGIDGSKWTSAALKAMYGQDNGATLEVPHESAPWFVELEAARAQKKLAEEHEAECKNQIAALMQDATFAVLPTGEKWSFKTQTKKEHLVKASTSRVLRKAGK